MTNKEACGPCAKRKVRCDKQEPSCSNCKRRKSDRCIYPPVSPTERIKRLEALVRKLGGDPTSNSATTRNTTHPFQSSGHVPQATGGTGSTVEIRSGDAMVLEQDGQSFYIESRALQNWIGNDDKNPFTLRKRPHAFFNLSESQNAIDLATRHPSPHHASILWDVFIQRVEPIVRITFRWRLQEVRTRLIALESLQFLTDPEHAFILAMYLVSINSMLDEECMTWLHESRQSLLVRYQAYCEEALLRANIFCITEILVLKALIFYMMASTERLSTHSLWSLMGLTIRSAERMGLHRDGLALGLSVEKTEERRRVWWQLQHIDLILAVWGGSTPMTLMADWDAKIPLNIEDEDISPSTINPPEERRGLTSMSFCRYTYWVLDRQRQTFRSKQGRFALSWQTNASLPSKMKDDVIQELEDGLNKDFLQFCDPIKPLDNLLQLSARFLIVGFRMRATYACLVQGTDKQQFSEEQRTALLDASIQCLQYNIAIHSPQPLKRFHWYTQTMFYWYAFMFVLVEASRENDMLKARETWDLLAQVYAVNPSLFVLSEDKRRYHAAELVVAAWKAWQQKFGPSAYYRPPPDFVPRLEAELAASRSESNQENTKISTTGRFLNVNSNMGPITPESVMNDDMNAIFDMDFQDIDWSYWSNME